MKYILSLIISLLTLPTLSAPLCQDLFATKNYFSLFFRASGDEFLSTAHLSRLRARPKVSIEEELEALRRDQVTAIESTAFLGTPAPAALGFDRLDEALTLEIRSFLGNAAFRDFHESQSRDLWAQFEARFLLDPENHGHLEFRELLWAAVALGALSGDLSLVHDRVSKMVYDAHRDPGLGVDHEEQELVLYALKHRLETYSIAGQFLEGDDSGYLVTPLASPSSRSEEPKGSLGGQAAHPKLLDWTFLSANLTSQELFLTREVFSWGGLEGHDLSELRLRAPRSFEEARDRLILELLLGSPRAATLGIFERALEWPASEEERMFQGVSAQGRPARTRWREAFQWIRSNPQQAGELVKDAVELRRFFPEIR